MDHFAAFALLLIFQLWLEYRDVTQMTYSEAVQAAQGGEVASVTIAESLIVGEFKAAQNGSVFSFRRGSTSGLPKCSQRRGSTFHTDRTATGLRRFRLGSRRR